jgi:hypothetical protein
MRKIYIALFGLLAAGTLQAQTILKYQSHGLVADTKNEMFITKYVEPGAEGRNAIWDFTNLELTSNFTGSLDDAGLSKGASIFTTSNVALEEFGNYFFFKSNENAIEQYGFLAGNGSLSIVYDVPFVKMRYPFAYGSSFSGPFSGSYNSNSAKLGDINGTYTVTGDGLGKLLLPGNVSYSNVLRVKEVKSYTQSINGKGYQLEDVTYRWYVDGHRYPLLVLIKSTSHFENGKSYSSTRAAYNPVIIQNTPLSTNTLINNLGLSVYPNPYSDFVNINVNLDNTSRLKISVFDMNGRLVKVLFNGVEVAGDKTYKFSAKDLGLSAGAYLIKLNVNGNEVTQKVVEL